VLVAAEEWEAMEETSFWLSQPGIREDRAQAGDDIAAGRTLDEDEVRQRAARR
jgi:antitoxin YefM